MKHSDHLQWPAHFYGILNRRPFQIGKIDLLGFYFGSQIQVFSDDS